MDIIAEQLVKCNIQAILQKQEGIKEASRRDCECLSEMNEDLQDGVEDPEMLPMVCLMDRG